MHANKIPFMPEDPVLAMAYVPYQQLQSVYTPEEAFSKGTLFPELDLPFTGMCKEGKK